MIELEEKFRNHILNKKITNLEMYNVNETYYVFDPESKWVIDGGIQISFGDSKFSFGWDYNNEGFDYSFKKDLILMLGEAPHYSLGARDVYGISSLIGKWVSDLSFKWQYYSEYNDDGEISDKKTYVPVELILTLNSTETLQLAIIDFNVTKEPPFKMENPTYDLGGEFLVSLNKKIKITNINNM